MESEYELEIPILKVTKEKLKCVCCRKTIPLSKVFMLSKQTVVIDGLKEMVIRYICEPCLSYTSTLHKTITEENIENIIQLLQNI